MNHRDFQVYHNMHIKFKYCIPETPIEELDGIVVDIINYKDKKSATEYVYISSNNVIAWKNAEMEKNIDEMNRLQRRIDIRYIQEPRLIFTSRP